MFGTILGSLGAGLASSLGSKLFGGGESATSFDVSKSIEDAGVKSSLQGSQVPPNSPVPPSSISGSQSIDWVRQKIVDYSRDLASAVGDSAFSAGIDSLFSKSPIKSASEAGLANRAYLDSAFPELNPWEKSGAAATGAGTAQAEQDNQMKMLDKQLDNQKDIARMNNDTQKDIAIIQARTSRYNTADTVYAQNELLSLNKSRLSQEILNLSTSRDLTSTQIRASLQSIIESQARTTGIHMTTEQTKALTSKAMAEISNIRQDTQNKRYGNGRLTSEAYSLSNAAADVISFGIDSLRSGWDKLTGGVGSKVNP